MKSNYDSAGHFNITDYEALGESIFALDVLKNEPNWYNFKRVPIPWSF